ncbi:MAG: DUF3800 domain-containing protein [Gammaproteobacteria bacterium]|nr:DUF3800 domain-containing protein [Gammaproteobacteria bacterium]
MPMFSDYIVYVDESGDHSLKSINPEHPIFVLAFCPFKKQDYIQRVVPAIQDLKFRHFGHDMIILHETDIRKSRPPFDILMNSEVRRHFMEELNGLIENTEFSIVASCIDKKAFASRRGFEANPYHVAMEFGLERIFYELQAQNQRDKLTHIDFEGRGKKEDAALELEFLRIMERRGMNGFAKCLKMVLADKSCNSSGLQLADMVARPIGRNFLEPDQPNRADDILEPKLRRSPQGKVTGWGLKCYP